MKAADENLVLHDEGLALLFTPPFDKTPLNPGYIKGYPPGIRENGGQYTHAAIWSVQALAKLGDGDKAAELLSLLNPINHARTWAEVQRYKVEPYVVCADIYSVAPHVGRGGWTWYTGSSGWMYRAGLESILGFTVEGDTLRFDPCIPRAWRNFEIVFRHRTTRYEIAVDNHAAVCRVIFFDGYLIARRTVPKYDLEISPCTRNARVEPQGVALNGETQDRLQACPIHPSGRSRVPGPAAAPDVGGN